MGNINYEDIFVDRVCTFFGTTYKETLKHRKERYWDHVVIRHLIFYYLCKYSKLSLAKIGQYYDKDHATVLNSKRKVLNLIDTNDSHIIMYDKRLDRVAINILKYHEVNEKDVSIVLSEILDMIKVSLGEEQLTKFKTYYDYE